MIEVLRMSVTLLADPTIGVNAQIAALTLNGADPRPPSIAHIFEPSSDFTAMDDAALAAGPYLICDDGEAPQSGAGQPFCNVIDTTIDLAVGYFASVADERALRTQAEYTMRAITQAFNAGWFTAANRPVYGRLNGVGIMASERRTIEIVEQNKYGRNLAARLRYELHVRDLRP